MVLQSQLPASISPNSIKRPSKKIRKAVQIMVYQGKAWDEAAEIAGCTKKSFRMALNRKSVLAYMAEQREVLRSSAGARAIHRIGSLMDGAKSERVQLEAAKYLDGAGKESNGTQVNVNVTMPGYVIDLSEPQEPSPQIVDLEPHEAKRLPQQADVPTSDAGTRPHPPQTGEKNEGRGG